jgi:hypothetical protein
MTLKETIYNSRKSSRPTDIRRLLWEKEKGKHIHATD